MLWTLSVVSGSARGERLGEDAARRIADIKGLLGDTAAGAGVE